MFRGTRLAEHANQRVYEGASVRAGMVELAVWETEVSRAHSRKDRRPAMRHGLKSKHAQGDEAYGKDIDMTGEHHTVTPAFSSTMRPSNR